jgi:hypothetical protein
MRALIAWGWRNDRAACLLFFIMPLFVLTVAVGLGMLG